jgi:hypothetical protein
MGVSCGLQISVGGECARNKSPYLRRDLAGSDLDFENPLLRISQ